MIENLLVYPEAMRRNLDQLGGLIHSQAVLLALTQAGLAREAAYALVQSVAIRVWAGEGKFLGLLEDEAEITEHLDPKILSACFDETRHTKHAAMIFDRVFGDA